MSRSLGQFWTAANMLSLLRAALAVPATYLILIDGPLSWILGLILLAVLTDWFDGHLARWSHTVSDWGKVLDPLADKVAALSVSLALVIRGTLPLWFVGFIFLRDIAIVLGGIFLARRTGYVVMSIWWGKVAVTALAVTVLAALLKADPPILQACIWITVSLVVYASILYVLRFIRVLRAGRVSTASSLEGEDGAPVPSLKQQTG